MEKSTSGIFEKFGNPDMDKLKIEVLDNRVIETLKNRKIWN